MIQQIKILIYVLAALGVGLLIVRMCVSREMRASLVNILIIATPLSQAIAFLSPHLIVFHVGVASLIPLLARQRHQVAPLYLYLLLTLPLVSIPLTVGGLYLLSYDVGISLAIGAAVAYAIAGTPQGRGAIALDLLVVALVALFTLAYARGTSLTNVMRVALDQSCLLILPYLIIRRAIGTPEDLRRVLAALVVAAVALSTLAVFEAVRAWPVYRTVWEHYGIGLGSGASVKMRGGFLRSPGPYPEPTSFALILAVALIAAAAIKPAFRSRLAHLIVFAVMILGILAPQSRGAWLGAGAGIMAAALFLNNWRMIGRTIAAVLAVGLAAGAAALASPRIAGLLGSYDDMTLASDYRTTLFARGVEEFWRSPLTGTPVDQVIFALRDITQGEGLVDFVNSYLFVALISGAVGLLVYAAALAWPMVQLLVERSRWRAAGQVMRMKAAVFAMLASMAVMLGFTSIGGRTTIMLVVLIALAGCRPVLRRA